MFQKSRIWGTLLVGSGVQTRRVSRIRRGLSQYSDVLLKHGFDDLEILMDVQEKLAKRANL
jgi:hypothetical protein